MMLLMKMSGRSWVHGWRRTRVFTVIGALLAICTLRGAVSAPTAACCVNDVTLCGVKGSTTTCYSDTKFVSNAKPQFVVQRDYWYNLNSTLKSGISISGSDRVYYYHTANCAFTEQAEGAKPFMAWGDPPSKYWTVNPETIPYNTIQLCGIRIACYDNNQWTYSSDFNFTYIATWTCSSYIEAPKITIPTAGTISTYNVPIGSQASVSLEWSWASTDKVTCVCKSFNVTLSSLTDARSIITSATCTPQRNDSAKSYFTLTRNVPSGFWRMNVSMSNARDPSIVRSIEYSRVCVQETPTTPKLISPQNNSVVLDLSPQLIWNSSSFGFSCVTMDTAYTVSIESLDGSYSVQTSQSPSGVATVTWQATDLPGDTMFKWKITATKSKSGESLSATSETFYFSTCVLTGPTTPTLGTENYILNPTKLAWQAPSSWGEVCSLPTISLYDVYVSVLSWFDLSSKMTPVPIVTTEFLLPFLEDNDYFWKVVAVGTGGNTSSATYQFTICTPSEPYAPALYSPANATRFINSGLFVTLEWMKVTNWGTVCRTNISTYDLLLDDVSILNTTSKTTSFTTTQGYHKWTVMAYNGHFFSETSAEFYFYICESTAPQLPSLSSMHPQENDTDNTFRRTFSWSDVSDWGNSCEMTTKQYSVSVRDPTGTITHVFVESPTASTYMVLPLTGRYSWWITAFNGLSNATTSVLSWDVCVPVAPSGIVLVSPILGSVIYTTGRIEFYWNISDWGVPCQTPEKTFFFYLGSSSTSLTLLGTTTSSNWTILFCPVNGTLYWGVASSNGVLNSTIFISSFIFNECTNSGPDTVTLKNPTINTTVTTNVTTLYWNPIINFGTNCGNLSYPHEYRVFLGRLNNATEFCRLSSSSDTRITTPVLPEGWWSWYIAVYNGFQQSISSAWQFFVCYPVPPGTPILSTPSNYFFISSVVLDWSAVNWGKSCGESESLSLAVVGGTLDFSTSIPITSSEYVFTGDFFGNYQKYTWKVTATKGGHVVSSETRNFTVCLPHAATVTLNPPKTDFYNGTVVLSWDATDPTANSCGRSIYYILYIRSAADSSELWINTTETKRTLILSEAKFNWNVKAYNGLEGPWGDNSSTVSPFLICISVRPSPASYLSPTNGSITVEPIWLVWSSTVSLGKACTGTSPVTYLFVNGGGFGEQLVATKLFSDAPQWYLPAYYPSGIYYWRVVFFNGEANSSSNPQMFSKCVPEAPGTFSLLTPANNTITPLSPNQILSWSSSSIGESCTRSQTMTYSIYLSRSNPPAFFTSTDSISFALSDWTFAVWYWKVIAQNSWYSTESSVAAFRICVSSPPTSAEMVSPLTAQYIDSPNFDLKFLATSNWGIACLSSLPQNYYSVSFGRAEQFQTFTIPGNSTGLITVPVYNVSQQQWSWQITTCNLEGKCISSMKSFFKVCQRPAATTLLYPLDNTSALLNTGVKLQWAPFTSEMVGSPCADTLTPPTIFVYMESIDSLGQDGIPYSVVFSAQSTAATETAEMDLPLNTTFCWRVALLSGYDTASSDTFFFTTRARDCTSVDCNGHGTCIDSTLECSCYYGWNGPFCTDHSSSEGTHGKSVNAIAVGVGVSGGAVCLIALLVGMALLAGRRRREKLPDFTSLKFTKVDVPPLNEAEQVLLAEKTNEVLAFLSDAGTSPFAPADALLQQIEITESENICKSLVYAYTQAGKGLDFVCHLVMKEVESCDKDIGLFRNNSNATKAFKFYSKIVGIEYMYRTLAVLFYELKKKQAEETDKAGSIELFETHLELDPEKLGDTSDENLNTLLLQLMCQKFVTQISKSAPHLPDDLKAICRVIHSSVAEKFPGRENVALGAFLFLRFFNTAIAMPEVFGLLPESPSSEFRHELTMVCKVLQGLANQVLFGNKEEFMVPLNGFLEDNFGVINRFYANILKDTPSTAAPTPVVIPSQYYESAIACIATQLIIQEGLQKQKQKKHKQ